MSVTHANKKLKQERLLFYNTEQGSTLSASINTNTTTDLTEESISYWYVPDELWKTAKFTTVFQGMEID